MLDRVDAWLPGQEGMAFVKKWEAVASRQATEWVGDLVTAFGETAQGRSFTTLMTSNLAVSAAILDNAEQFGAPHVLALYLTGRDMSFGSNKRRQSSPNASLNSKELLKAIYAVEATSQKADPANLGVNPSGLSTGEIMRVRYSSLQTAIAFAGRRERGVMGFQLMGMLSEADRKVISAQINELKMRNLNYQKKHKL